MEDMEETKRQLNRRKPIAVYYEPQLSWRKMYAGRSCLICVPTISSIQDPSKPDLHKATMHDVRDTCQMNPNTKLLLISCFCGCFCLNQSGLWVLKVGDSEQLSCKHFI